MQEIQVYDAVNKPTEIEKDAIVDFLFQHLEQYGDPKAHIRKAIDYSVKDFISFGGHTILFKEHDEILGAVVINKTGMGGYIPENILVYIATHDGHRGKGIGKQLIEKTIEFTSGDIALHVEQNNPAKGLYEKFGFTNPYLEMRLKK